MTQITPPGCVRDIWPRRRVMKWQMTWPPQSPTSTQLRWFGMSWTAEWRKSSQQVLSICGNSFKTVGKAFQVKLVEQMPRLCTTRSEEHTSELQSPREISYAVFCLKKKNYFLHCRIIVKTAKLWNRTVTKQVLKIYFIFVILQSSHPLPWWQLFTLLAFCQPASPGMLLQQSWRSSHICWALVGCFSFTLRSNSSQTISIGLWLGDYGGQVI